MSCVRPFEFKILAGRFQGAADAIYPQLAFVNKISFSRPYALIGLQLSSSLVIYGNNFGGFAIVIGQTNARLSVSEGLNCPMTQITQPNSLVGPPVVPIPTSKSASDSYGLFAYPIPPQTPISLYAFGDATAGNDMFAICSLKLARLL